MSERPGPKRRATEAACPGEGKPRPATSRGPRWRRVWLGLVGLAAAAIFAALFAASNARELWRTAAGIDPRLLALPVAFALASYGAMALSYRDIATAAGYPLPLHEWLRITFVSNTVNYLVTTAGLSGFAVRMFLLARRRVPAARAVLISLVQTFLTQVTLLLFMLGGLAVLVARHDLAGTALAAGSAAVGVLALLSLLTTVLVVRPGLRRRAIASASHLALRATRLLGPRWQPQRARLRRAQRSINDGLDFLLARKRRMVAPTAYVFLDWVLAALTLWSAFIAVHRPVSVGVAVIGFAVGVFLSLVSLVPGGLGVMEGSVTAALVGLGVPLEPAVVAVVIFRLAYYAMPLLVSLFLFHGLVVEAARQARRPSAARAAEALGARGAAEFDNPAGRL